MSRRDTDSGGGARLPVSCEGSIGCRLTRVVALICRKWHPVIIHRLAADGPSRFTDLEGAIDGVSRGMLVDSLRDLEHKRLVDREPAKGHSRRVEYSLTGLGESIVPIVEAMDEWAAANFRPADPGEEAVV